MSNITYAPFPIPVVTPKGSGYIVYVKCNAMWENDEVCVAMDDGGQWLHFNTGQIKSWKNATYGINAGPSKEDLIEEFLSNRHPAWREALKPEREPFTNTLVDLGVKKVVGDKKEWTDELVVQYIGFYDSRKRAVRSWENIPLDFEQKTINEFKEKHNIK